MAQASQFERDSRELRLEDALLYLFGKESNRREGEDLIIPLSSVHKIVDSIESDLQDMGIQLKFHESPDVVHSKQVDEAINKLVPYIIPVRNPSFSLDIYQEVGLNALREAEQELSEEQIETLESVFESPQFQQAIRDHTKGSRGD